MRKDNDPTRLLRFVLISAMDGIAAGWLALLALLWLDIGGLGTRVHVGIVWGVMVRLPDAD